MYIHALNVKIYYKARPAWTDFPEEVLVKFDGDFWYWARIQQRWIKYAYLFKECANGHLSRIDKEEGKRLKKLCP
jgi:hypothetical protein